MDTLWTDTEYGKDKITWLMYACVQNREPLVALLIERGANKTVENDWGWRALHFAAVAGSAEIVWRLLQAGDDVERKTQGPSIKISALELANLYENAGAAAKIQYALDLKSWYRSGMAAG